MRSPRQYGGRRLASYVSPVTYVAAQGLTEDLDQQVAIAAGLMDLPEDEVRPLVAKMVRPRSSTEKMIQTSRGTARVVVVERKNRFSEVTPRRLATPRVPLTLR